MSMLENKNSEAGFREQFELYQLRLKEEERVAWLSKHKENVAAMGDQSKELQAYVQQHFDQQRTLLNHQGQKGGCGGGCEDMNNNQHVLS
mgnify:CR=1 FL=1